MAAVSLPGFLLPSWQAWRNRTLASPRFQAWAVKFPLTRPVARREARALFDICAGFVYAQTLQACIQLDLFELLAKGPLTAKMLAARADMQEPAMLTLLKAASSLRLLSTVGAQKFGLGPLGAALRGNPGIAAMVAHHRVFYADLADPVALLRGQSEARLSRFWPYRGGGGGGEYAALMAQTQPMIASEVLGVYDFSKHICLLDVGGGDGAFLAAVAKGAPELALQLFDLPAVAAQARARFAQAGLRAAVFGGDIYEDALPQAADIITLVRVLHDHDDGRALALLRAVRAALPPGGTLLIAEPLAGAAGAAPVGDAYFGFYLLAMGSGRPRRAAEITAMLGAAGFSGIRQLPTNQPMLASVIVAGV